MAKKLLTLLLCLVMCFNCFALASCYNGDEGVETEDKDKDSKKKLDNAYGFIIRDLKLEVEGAPSAIKLGLFELYLADDGKGGVIGGGSGTVKVPMSIQGYSTTAEYKASMYVENKTAYLYVKQSSMGASQVVVYSFDAATIIDCALASQNMSLDELESYKDLTPAIEAWIEDSLIPSLGDVDSLIPSDTELEGVKEDVKAFIELFINKEVGSKKTTVTINFDTFKSWHNMLKDDSVDELCDYLFGDGAFASIQDAVPGILAFSVSDLIGLFEENGGDVSDIIDAIDALLPLMGAPEGTTIEQLLSSSGALAQGQTVEQLLKSEEMEDMTVALLLMTALKFEAASDLDDAINSLFANLSSMTAYQLMGLSSEVIESIGTAIDSISQMVDFSVILDKDGKITEAKLGVSMPGDSGLSEVATVTTNVYAKKIVTNVKFDIPESAKGSFSVELVKETRGFYNAKELKEIKKDITAAKNAASIDNLTEALCDELGVSFDDCEKVYENGKIVGVVIPNTAYYGTVVVDVKNILAVAVMSGSENAAMVNYVLSAEYLGDSEDVLDNIPEYPIIDVTLTVNLKNGKPVK